MKARFKAARLLPGQLFAGWRIAENFSQSSNRLYGRPPPVVRTGVCEWLHSLFDGEDHRMAVRMSETRFLCARRTGLSGTADTSAMGVHSRRGSDLEDRYKSL